MSPLLRLKLFVLLGALLLLGMEPLVGRLILPSCGGGYQVWATCLMFFQGALFLGYLYCHLLGQRLGRGHLVLVLLPLLFLPIGRGLWELDPDPHSPIPSILLALLLGIGLPFAVLATTGVIAQRWLADSDLPERENPYQLFAASNLGSLLALLGYPLVVEPFLGLQTQRWVWSVAFLAYVGLAVWVAPRARTETEPEVEPDGHGHGHGHGPRTTDHGPRTTDHEPRTTNHGPRTTDHEPRPTETDPAYDSDSDPDPEREHETVTVGQVVAWILLSAAPSACLLAVTNAIAIDVGSVPLVWVVPLSLYLLTFIVTFGPRERYPALLRSYWPEALALGLLFWLWWVDKIAWVGPVAHVALAAAVHLGVLTAVCWVGHAELYRARPAPRHLTAFYLCVSLGGWLGGVFVSVVAPLVFSSLVEYPLSLFALAATLLVWRRQAFKTWLDRAPAVRKVLSFLIIVLALLQALTLAVARQRASIRLRNFYGIYQVATYRDPATGYDVRALLHGTTFHGKELTQPALWGLPIGYFHARSPLGELVRTRPRPLRLAIVGLGAGALTGHLRAGDEVTYYEIDPDVERLAREHFHYLDLSRGEVHPVVAGDARLRLREAPAAAFDMILVDAFSSDAIPIHLLTREALQLYLRKLAPGGVLAFHISTRYYDLRPVLHATGGSLDPPLVGAFKSRLSGLARHEDPSKAFVLARNAAGLAPYLRRGWVRAADAQDVITIAPWTDDYANLLAALWARRYERD